MEIKENERNGYNPITSFYTKLKEQGNTVALFPSLRHKKAREQETDPHLNKKQTNPQDK